MFTTYRVPPLRPAGKARAKRPLNVLFDIVRNRLQGLLGRAAVGHAHGKNCRAGAAGSA